MQKSDEQSIRTSQVECKVEAATERIENRRLSQKATVSSYLVCRLKITLQLQPLKMPEDMIQPAPEWFCGMICSEIII